MTKPEDEKLSFDEVKIILQKEIDDGKVLSRCPLCSQYLNYTEYKTLKCSGCKKKIKFEDILYYPGASKNNN